LKINLEKEFFDYIEEWDEEELVAIIPVKFITRGFVDSKHYVYTHIDFIQNKITMHPVEEIDYGFDDSGFDLHKTEKNIMRKFLLETLGVKLPQSEGVSLNTSYSLKAASS